MVFVYVCLDVADFSVMYTSWDSVEPIRYGVCNVFGGVGAGLLQVVPSFASWFEISLLEIPVCALTFCVVMLCLVQRILVDYG